MPGPRSTTSTTRRQRHGTEQVLSAVAAVRTWPAEGFNAQFRAEYDTQFHAIRTMSADGTIAVRDWLHATFGWSQRRFVEGLSGFNDPDRLDHYLNSASSWKAWRNRIGGVYTFNYDIKTGRFLQQRMMIYYNAQCCGFAVEYQQFDLSAQHDVAGAEGPAVELLVHAGRHRVILEFLRRAWAAASGNRRY